MFERKVLSEAEARSAMESGEFPEAVRTAALQVAVVLTQDWCPQWTSMSRMFDRLERSGGSDDLDMVVFELEYNRVPYGGEFMEFKERVLGNDLIPYVRYYRDGKLVDTSNYVTEKEFLSRFG